jgi:protoporphyrinogen/coproporphyrinogen III oxidase
VWLSSPVTALRREPGIFRLGMGDGSAGATLEADAVVLATPAFVSAGLVESLSASAAAALRGVRYVDVATVTLTYPADAVRHRMDATGFLVPPAEGRLIVACSWMSAKWHHLSSARVVVLRAVVGRAGDQRWAALDDPALIGRVHAELAEAMRLCAPPRHAHVQRWPRALPQYTVGHQDRFGRLDAALKTVPGLHVTGAAYHSAGVVGCISQAERCAAAVLARFPVPARLPVPARTEEACS